MKAWGCMQSGTWKIKIFRRRCGCWMAEPSDFPITLGAHDIGLKDLIESAILLESLPDIYLITIRIQLKNELSMELTPHLKRTFPIVERKVREILAAYA